MKGKNPKKLGVIFAGGRARRMKGQNKADVLLGGRPLLEHVLERLSPQVDRIILSGPGGKDYGLDVVPDLEKNPRGPLAGLIAARKWASENFPANYAIITAAVDTPFFPGNLVQKLETPGGPAVAWTGQDMHPTFGYWPGGVLGKLDEYLKRESQPALRKFADFTKAKPVDFKNPDLFFNINSPDDLNRAEALL